jgi:methionyl-tRNA formyltransferase
MPLRLVFMGTPDFAVPTLCRLVADGHEVAAVYTRAPKPAGRGMALSKSPVHRLAEELRIPVETPKGLRAEGAAEQLAAYAPEVAVIVAYGVILPRAILDVPMHGFLNVHASLLPRWRGAAPIQRAVMAGDAKSGVSIMRVEEALDSGPVALAGATPIGADETAGELHDRLAAMGGELMGQALRRLEAGTLRFTEQPVDGVTYAQKISKAETRIDWSLPAGRVHDHIRGLSPFPGAWVEADLGRGIERVKVLRTTLAAGSGAPGELLDEAGTVACGAGAVTLAEVQRAGKAPMSFADFFRGARLAPGTRLDGAPQAASTSTRSV